MDGKARAGELMRTRRSACPCCGSRYGTSGARNNSVPCITGVCSELVTNLIMSITGDPFSEPDVPTGDFALTYQTSQIELQSYDNGVSPCVLDNIQIRDFWASDWFTYTRLADSQVVEGRFAFFACDGIAELITREPADCSDPPDLITYSFAPASALAIAQCSPYFASSTDITVSE